MFLYPVFSYRNVLTEKLQRMLFSANLSSYLLTTTSPELCAFESIHQASLVSGKHRQASLGLKGFL